MKKISFLLALFWACLYQNSVLSHPLDKTEGFLLTYDDFLEENIRRVAQHNPAQKPHLEHSQDLTRSFQLEIEQALETLDSIKKDDPTNQQRGTETFLQTLLIQRLERLKTRTEGALDGINKGCKQLAALNPIYICNFENKKDNLEIQVLLESLKLNWDFHQLLVKHVFHAIEDPLSLSLKTKTLLQLSPSLWDLLTYKTYDLGDPDEVSGYGAFWWIKDHLDEDSSEEICQNPVVKAAYLYQKIVIEHRLHFTPTQLRRYQRLLPTLDGELYRAYVDRYIEKKEPDLMLGRKGNTFTILKTPLETGLLGSELLKEPEFLFGKKEESFLPTSSTHHQTGKPQKKLLKPKLPPFNSSHSISQVMTTKSEEEKEVQIQASTIPETEPAKEPVKEKEIQTIVAEEILDQSDEEEDQNSLQNLVGQETPHLQYQHDFVFPRGIRIFHPEATGKDIPVVSNPNTRVQTFVNRLFDETQLNHITFADFEKNWERIGGQIIKNRGGSHRQLLAPDGTPLWGTFDHGGFGKQTIGYLQAAFWLQGYKPE